MRPDRESIAELSASMARAAEAIDDAGRLARDMAVETRELGALLERIARRLENAAAQVEIDRRSAIAAATETEERSET